MNTQCSVLRTVYIVWCTVCMYVRMYSTEYLVAVWVSSSYVLYNTLSSAQLRSALSLAGSCVAEETPRLHTNVSLHLHRQQA